MELEDRWTNLTKYLMALMESKESACDYYYHWFQARLAASAQLLAAILVELHHYRWEMIVVDVAIGEMDS